MIFFVSTVFLHEKIRLRSNFFNRITDGVRLSQFKGKDFLRFLQSFIKLAVKISSLLIGLPVKPPQYIQIQIFFQRRILCPVKNLLHLQKKFMPVKDKFLIALQIWNIDSLFHFDLCAVFVDALMDLQDIPESVLYVISSQRKQAAESGTEFMDCAAPLLIQKYAAFLWPSHRKMRKDIAVRHAQFQFSCQ